MTLLVLWKEAVSTLSGEQNRSILSISSEFLAVASLIQMSLIIE